MQSRLQTSLARWLSRQPSGGAFRGDGFSLGTQKGLVRGENQDRVAVAKFFPRESNQELLIGVLCDGMGGMTAGGQCAEIAVSTFMTVVLGRYYVGLPTVMLEAAEIANQAVFETFHGDGGATLTAIAVYGGTVCAVNVGDSRVYSLRANNTIIQESQDDTVSSRLAAMGEASENARTDLLQYIGMGPDLSPHLLRDLDPGHIRGILLTSDGAHSVPPSVLAGLAAHAQFPKDLIERLLSVSLWLGGRDNATALALTFQRRHQRPSYTDALEFFGPSGEMELPVDYLSYSAQVFSLQRAPPLEDGTRRTQHGSASPPGEPTRTESAEVERPGPLPGSASDTRSESEYPSAEVERVASGEGSSSPQARHSRSRKNRARKSTKRENSATLPDVVIEGVPEPLSQERADDDVHDSAPSHSRRLGKGGSS